MAQQVNTLATKSDGPSSIPGSTHKCLHTVMHTSILLHKTSKWMPTEKTAFFFRETRVGERSPVVSWPSTLLDVWSFIVWPCSHLTSRFSHINLFSSWSFLVCLPKDFQNNLFHNHSIFILFWFCFEIGSLSIVLSVLELDMWTRVASNS